ncbi:hypothetical protein [Flavisolibacter ginsenosidimutans]|uniref:Uncharacterized protein n=1 Tax=Flavisolibacter ginsenosidimutans TaxID=661481 RepID=A0A5B8UPS3_9BACT|nr:hypothetical protein [Flavisolibacter ginsenosidimutans]QEC57945.1 hypothetical protein FSB75_19215 [Flavisolibacter ginsenosidimutans]
MPTSFRKAADERHCLEAIVINQLYNPSSTPSLFWQDITQRIETEEKLKELHLLKAVMEGEEKERGRIAQELIRNIGKHASPATNARRN